jgi:hypothetical protein
MAKKKKVEAALPLGVQEHDGWKLGQVVWCKLLTSDELASGPIYQINLKDSEPCFTFIDKFSGSFRMALFSSIIALPTAAMQEKLIRALARSQRAADRKIEKRIERAKGKK